MSAYGFTYALALPLTAPASVELSALKRIMALLSQNDIIESESDLTLRRMQPYY